MDNTKEFRLLSLCSGYGGLELGLHRVIPNLRTVAYVEVEAFACANLVSKMEKGYLDAAPIWTDIKTFDGQPFRGKVHGISAGYPCQPFSVAGKRQGTDDPRHLWPYIERILATVRPLWFFGENVSGHLTIGYPTVYRSLRDMGYSVEAGIFSAAECGAPHRRERLFILAKSSRTASSNQNRQIKGGVGQKDVSQGNRATGTIRLGATSQLADTKSRRRPRQDTSIFEPTRQMEGKTNSIGERSWGEIMQCCRWPTRPGQPQYEWEEPRVVDDARKQKPTRLSDNEQQTISEVRKTGARQAQSRLGRAVDGTNCRVDRLRLLGNGIVPQQAEKAFRYLIEKF